MNVLQYVKKNYKKLPKSTFNSDELVVVFTMHDSNEGWRHHNYSAYGVDKSGKLFYCFSSGCSCSGHCGIDHKPDLKTLSLDGYADFPNFETPEKIDYVSQQTDKADYE